jgi:long-chain acyl-CoA synthetase
MKMSGNFAERLDAAARDGAERTVIHADGASFTWATIAGRASALARDLVAQGLKPGERVAIGGNSPLDTVIGAIGGLKAGGVICPLNPRLRDDERQQILDLLKPATIVETIPDTEDDFGCVKTDPEDPAIILFTSGSTGVPKGVILSHRSVHAGMDIWIRDSLAIRPDDVMISVLPLAHSYGLFGTILSPLLVGAQTVLLPRFDIDAVLDAISRHKATIFPGVATMFRRMLDTEALAVADLSSLRFVTSGAAPCPWELAEAWREATGTRIVRGYGMSELYRPISYSPDDTVEIPESIGHANTGVSLRIVDEDARALEIGETGELWICSPSCMTEYIDRPEETAAVLEGEWFKTGDLARITDEGLVCIVGRKKEIILRGGYTVAAGEVEAVLITHPGIDEAAVIAVPDRDLGEEICAYVTRKRGVEADEDGVIAYCKERMAPYKYPRFVRFVDDLPRGPTGKVDKAQLDR